MSLVLALAACRQPETQLAQIQGAIAVIPAISDVGDVLVGDTAALRLQITHLAGPDVTIDAVDVFSVDGAPWTQIGDLPVVEQDSNAFVDIEYAPIESGYHRAVITVFSDAERTPEIVVEGRGHGVDPDIQQWPGVLDYGPVLPPDDVVRTVTIRNRGSTDLLVTGATLSRPDLFAVDTTLPAMLLAGTETALAVSFHPADAAVVGETVAFQLGPYITLPNVILQANNCATGTPDLYDVDGDGWTSCGGDCDDGDADIWPGSPEVADGDDQDCDQIVDEGTGNYDDDGDCFCEGSGCLGSIDPGCTSLATGDCNDGDGDASPGIAETLGNGIDDDCNGVVDLGSTDNDSDGYSPAGGDCNDSNASVRPGAAETADGLDNDCDGTRDEGTVRYDDDGDGYCEVSPCTDGTIAGDCDDSADDVDNDFTADGYDTHPNATELEDGRDNNCDGSGVGGTNRVDEGTNRSDDDGDGFTEDGGDCDDADPLASPARVEVPGNGRDDDCNIATAD